MDARPREKLKELIAENGPELQDDARRVRALLLDTCPDHRRELAVLVAAAEEGMPGRLSRLAGVTSTGGDIERLSAQLERDRGLTRDAARWAVQSWAWAYGLAPPPVDAVATAQEGPPADDQPLPPSPPRPSPPRVEAATPRRPAGTGPGQPRRRGVPVGNGLLGAGAVGVVLVGVILAVVLSARPSSPTTEPSSPDTTSSTAPAPGPAPPAPVETDLTPDWASATSTAEPGIDAAGTQISYDATNVADGSSETAWRTPGDGIGEKLTLGWDREVHLTSIGLVPGYDKIDQVDGTDRFFQNRRVVALRYEFSDGSTADQTLEDSRDRQEIAVDVTTTSVAVVILDSTDDPERDFTAISEISFRGWETG